MSDTIIPGAEVGHWLVLAVDATGRRAGCRCRCGTVREVSVAALTSGTSTSCGCAPLSSEQVESLASQRWNSSGGANAIGDRSDENAGREAQQ